MAYSLPELPYGYDPLEPHIDARTIEIHHSKHHNANITKVNDAPAGPDRESVGPGKKNVDLFDAHIASVNDSYSMGRIHRRHRSSHVQPMAVPVDGQESRSLEFQSTHQFVVPVEL